MRLSIIVPVLNQYKLFAEVLNTLARHTEHPDTEFILVDNGSTEGGQKLRDALNRIGIDWGALRKFKELKIFTNDENVGNYPIFKQTLYASTGQILCYLHSDFFVHESSWDIKVRKAFEEDNKLALIGFIGSNEIDNFGGRGNGTMSNFQGHTIKEWKGSSAEVHGRRIQDLQPAAIVDGCSMIFRRQALWKIGFKDNFPIHHFYDRLFCCQVLEEGWHIGVLGIASDHISGQTANTQEQYQEAGKKWAKKFLGIESPEQWALKFSDWVNNQNNPSKGVVPKNYDHLIYLEAERQFLTEWRDKKHFVPLRVDENYNVKR